jgi:aminomethyltransferase
MKKTILHDIHVSLGAKMAPFGGFVMPIQYEGIIAEHFATRTAATIFDTCHMGEFHIHGGNALSDLDKIVSCSIASMSIGQCRYGFICNEQGGVIDDQITYRLGDNDFYMVVNAGTQDNDFEWISSHLSASTRRENRSSETAKIDLQGPASAKIMQKLMEKPVDDMKYYHFKHNRYRGKEVLTSRTGYTGEVGFEIYCDNILGLMFWNDCLELGAKPAGLGARDTLRLEVGYPLYGHELSAGRNAAESNFPLAIARDKDFIGAGKVKDSALMKNSLVGLMLADRRAARDHDIILDNAGNEIGIVTSGSFSPSLQKSIAMGYVKNEFKTEGTAVKIKTARGELPATVCKTPFYKEATARKPLASFL